MQNLILMALFLVTAIVYERSVSHIAKEYDKLERYKADIATMYKAEEARKINLERQIMSQSDPNWIVLTLIRVLGVVPEGQTKVYFKP